MTSAGRQGRSEAPAKLDVRTIALLIHTLVFEFEPSEQLLLACCTVNTLCNALLYHYIGSVASQADLLPIHGALCWLVSASLCRSLVTLDLILRLFFKTLGTVIAIGLALNLIYVFRIVYHSAAHFQFRERDARDLKRPDALLVARLTLFGLLVGGIDWWFFGWAILSASPGPFASTAQGFQLTVNIIQAILLVLAYALVFIINAIGFSHFNYREASAQKLSTYIDIFARGRSILLVCTLFIQKSVPGMVRVVLPMSVLLNLFILISYLRDHYVSRSPLNKGLILLVGFQAVWSFAGLIDFWSRLDNGYGSYARGLMRIAFVTPLGIKLISVIYRRWNSSYLFKFLIGVSEGQNLTALRRATEIINFVETEIRMSRVLGEQVDLSPHLLKLLGLLRFHSRHCFEVTCLCHKLQDLEKEERERASGDGPHRLSNEKRIGLLKQLILDVYFRVSTVSVRARLPDERFQAVLEAIDLEQSSYITLLNLTRIPKTQSNMQRKLMGILGCLSKRTRLIDSAVTSGVGENGFNFGALLKRQQQIIELRRDIERFVFCLLDVIGHLRMPTIGLGDVKKAMERLSILEETYNKNFAKASSNNFVKWMDIRFRTTFRLEKPLDIYPRSVQLNSGPLAGQSPIKLDTEFLVANLNETGSLRIVHTSEDIELLTGYKKSFLIGCPVEKLIPDELQTSHRLAVNRYLSTGRSKFLKKSQEIFLVDAYNRLVPILSMAKVILDALGLQLSFVMAFCRSKNTKNLILCDNRGNLMRASQDLIELFRIPSHSIEPWIPVYLFFEQLAKILIKILESERLVCNPDEVCQTYINQKSEVVNDNFLLNKFLTAGLTRSARKIQVANHKSVTRQENIALIASHSHQFSRWFHKFQHQIPVRMNVRIYRCSSQILFGLAFKDGADWMSKHASRRFGDMSLFSLSILKLFVRRWKKFGAIQAFYRLNADFRLQQGEREHSFELDRNIRAPGEMPSAEQLFGERQPVHSEDWIARKFQMIRRRPPIRILAFWGLAVIFLFGSCTIFCVSLAAIWRRLESLTTEYIKMSMFGAFGNTLAILGASRFANVTNYSPTFSIITMAKVINLKAIGVRGGKLLKGRLIRNDFPIEWLASVNPTVAKQTLNPISPVPLPNNYNALLQYATTYIVLSESVTAKYILLQSILETLWAGYQPAMFVPRFQGSEFDDYSLFQLMSVLASLILACFLLCSFVVFIKQQRYLSFLYESALYFDFEAFDKQTLQSFAADIHSQALADALSDSRTCPNVSSSVGPAKLKGFGVQNFKRLFYLTLLTVIGFLLGIYFVAVSTAHYREECQNAYLFMAAVDNLQIMVSVRLYSLLDSTTTIRFGGTIVANSLLDKIRLSSDFYHQIPGKKSDVEELLDADICQYYTGTAAKDCANVTQGLNNNSLNIALTYLMGMNATNYQGANKSISFTKGKMPTDLDRLCMIILVAQNYLINRSIQNFNALYREEESSEAYMIMTFIYIILGFGVLGVVLRRTVDKVLRRESVAGLRMLTLLNPRRAFAISCIRRFLERGI